MPKFNNIINVKITGFVFKYLSKLIKFSNKTLKNLLKKERRNRKGWREWRAHHSIKETRTRVFLLKMVPLP